MSKSSWAETRAFLVGSIFGAVFHNEIKRVSVWGVGILNRLFVKPWVKTRSELDAPRAPFAVLGNQYVTFQGEQQEEMRMREKIWASSASYEVVDAMNNPWFKFDNSQKVTLAKVVVWF